MGKVFYSLKKVHAQFQAYYHYFLSLLLLPSASFAQASSSEDTLTNILNNAISYAQAGPARALCILAIAGAGYLWIGKGALPKAYAIAIMGGSGFIFGAGYIGSKVLGIN